MGAFIMAEVRMPPDVSARDVLIGASLLVAALMIALVHVAWRTDGILVAEPATEGVTPWAPNLYGNPMDTLGVLEKNWTNQLDEGPISIDDAMKAVVEENAKGSTGGDQ